ncbi:MAG TPA: DUF763 domain-containing protein [Saprospiraceae bacterium]|nr:DUF763 domain-containing protein [Saprospiraceae bacterium]
MLLFNVPKLHFNHQRRYADLPLHYGQVPQWLAQRMSALGGAIVEAIVIDYGKKELLKKLSDPFWFQALGCVLGMDWHSSGVTTSVMGALKRSLNPRFKDLGIYIAGGKGRYSRQTPNELIMLAEKTGLPGHELVRSSKLTAKVDNTAIQDGFQLYHHTFIVTDEGDWAVVQQGMNEATGMARRYHWNSSQFASYTKEPHTSIYGHNVGLILNLTHADADNTKSSMLNIIREKPELMMQEIQHLMMPSHHDVRIEDVNLKRLGAMLAMAHEKEIRDFDSLLMLEGLGPRTIQSLALVSEVVHGTPTRFSDPARFSFAHGGKDGHPFPVPLKVYDETIQIMEQSIQKAKLGEPDKKTAIKNLSHISMMLEESFTPDGSLDKLIEHERQESYKYDGRTVFGKAQKGIQGRLF